MINLCYPKFWHKPNIISYLLLPFAGIYFLLGVVRKFCAQPIKFNAYTICVGNVTIGGTGKTQVVIELATELNKHGISFIILSKGYGGSGKHYSLVTETSSPHEVGDEALELCKYGTTFTVPDMQYATEIISKYKPDIVLIDDGMQNPNFIKDFIIMTVDGTRGFGNEMLIPSGPMRSSLRDALDITNAIVIVDNNDICLESKISRVASNKPIFSAIIDSQKTAIKRYRYYAFSGIGNPERFYKTLKAAGFVVDKKQNFPDHYAYSRSDVMKLINEAHNLGLKLITTRKDYVKLRYVYYESEWSIDDVAKELLGASSATEKLGILPVECLDVKLHINNIDALITNIIALKHSLVKV